MSEWIKVEDEKYTELIYKPSEYALEAQKATLGVKFSSDIFVSKYLLDKLEISYKEEDLEEGPWGKGLRIKRDE